MNDSGSFWSAAIHRRFLAGADGIQKRRFIAALGPAKGLQGPDYRRRRDGPRAGPEAGTSDYIAKPVNSAQLLSLLRAWVGRQATPSA
jgi:hypothetical protein